MNFGNDLRSFITEYEKTYPGEIIRVKEEISNRFQVTALVSKLEKLKKFPVLFFDKVNINGQRSPFPLITFLMSSRLRLARLLGCSVPEVGVSCYQRIQQGIKARVVSRDEAPVKEVVITGPEIDLRGFPALVHHEMDPGPYITGGFLTCYDPDTGVENSALHRGWIKGADEIRVYLSPASHNYLIYQKHEQAGKEMRAAFWIGHHPLVILGCEARIPMTRSHYETAGGLLCQPLRLTPSQTLGEDFLVPADAEVVIEGVIPPYERRPEAPFGEYPRYTGPQRWNPYMRVTAITHRKQPLWYDIMLGYTHWIFSPVIEGVAYENIKRVAPTLINVYAPMSGCGAFHIYVQLKVTVPGLSRTALIAALNSYPQIKHAFVFDEDVDIFDEKEVLLALATRFQGDKDLIILDRCLGPPLDPSAEDAIGTKVGFDCTKPAFPKPFSKRLGIPKEVMESTSLEKYIPESSLEHVSLETYG